MSDTLVKVENVSKKFCRSLKRSLWYGMQDIGAELLGRSHSQNGLPPLRADEFWAVQDINFELKRGDCLGLIGRNGAGKSTLLKMLNGLLKPDTGRIEMRGRIGALIELGTGFNPILTGRENVYVNGSVLGFAKREIDKKLDEIIDFAEIGEFIDMPVKNYSSGMKVRLGFAVAAQMEPDVLLVDEVLAVGDLGFKIKCFNRINELLEQTAIIFVTHNIPQVDRICTDLLVLNKGTIAYQGLDLGPGIDLYYSMFEQQQGNSITSERANLVSFYLNTSITDDDEITTINYGDPAKILLDIEMSKDLDDLFVVIAFVDRNLRDIATVCSLDSDLHVNTRNGFARIEINIPMVPFSPGYYSITIRCSEGKGGGFLFRHEAVSSFQVKSHNVHGWAPVQLQSVWQQID